MLKRQIVNQANSIPRAMILLHIVAPYWLCIAGGCSNPSARPTDRVGSARPTTVRVIVSDEAVPQHVATDDARVYWLSATTGEIAAASLTGGARVSLGRVDGSDGPLLVYGGFLYFLADRRSSIARVALAGGGSEMLIREQEMIASFALDGAEVFWLAKDSTRRGARGFLKRRAIAGGQATILAETAGVSAAGVVVAADQVFFGTTSSLSDGLHGGLYRVPRSGGAPQHMATFDYPLGNLAVTDDFVFVTVLASPWRIPVLPGGDKVFRVPRVGGSATVVASAAVLGPRVLAHGQRLIFVERDFPPGSRPGQPAIVPVMLARLRMIDGNGGASVVVAEGQPGPAGMVMAGDWLIWANTGPVDGNGGSIVATRLP